PALPGGRLSSRVIARLNAPHSLWRTTQPVNPGAQAFSILQCNLGNLACVEARSGRIENSFVLVEASERRSCVREMVNFSDDAGRLAPRFQRAGISAQVIELARDASLPHVRGSQALEQTVTFAASPQRAVDEEQ